MTDEIREALEEARTLVEENERVLERVQTESRHSDKQFESAYESLQTNLGILSRAWR